MLKAGGVPVGRVPLPEEEKGKHMKALIVYDSVAGNTEKIAQAIAAGMAGGTRVLRVGGLGAEELEGVDLLVIGSPTHGGRPTEAMQGYIDRIPQAAARRLHIAAFDTRLAMKFVRIFGYAAERIADKLEASGSTVLLKPEGFVVKGRQGPPAEGELERAAAWGKEIASIYLAAP